MLIAACSVEASVVAPFAAPVAYAKTVPYNVLPFANSVNIYSRILSLPVPAAPAVVPAFLRTPVAHAAYAPVAPVPAPVYNPAVRLNSLLPAPFAPAPAVAPIGAQILPRAVPHAVAPGVAHAVAPGVAHAVAPGVAHAVAPGVAHAVAPGIAHAVAPALAPAVVRTAPSLFSAPAAPAFLSTHGSPYEARSVHSVAQAYPGVVQNW